MIRRISYESLKGRTESHDLPPAALFVGPNGAGKSTILEAVTLAVLGYLPRIGKQPSATLSLASADTMRVTADLGSLQIERSWNRGAGGAKTSARLEPSFGEKSLAAVEARILEEIGDVAPLMDLAEFFALSDAKRREFLFDLCGAAGNGTGDLLAKIDAPEALRADLARIAAGHPPAVALGRMRAWLKDRVSQGQAQKAEADAILRRRTGEAGEIVEASAIADVRGEISRLTEDLAQVREQIAVTEAQAKAVGDRERREITLQARIDEFKARIAQVPPDGDAKAQAGLREIDAKIARAAEIAGRDAQPLANQSEMSTAAAADLLARVRAAEQRSADIQKTLDRIAKVSGKCVIGNRIPCATDMQAIARRLVADRKSIDAEIAGLGSQAEIACRQRDGLAGELDAIREVKTAAANVLRQLERERSQIVQSAAEIGVGLARDRESLAQTEAEMAAVRAKPVDNPADPGILVARRTGIEQTLGAARARLSDLEAKKALQVSAAEAGFAAETLAESVAQLKTAEKALGPAGLVGDLLGSGALDPLVEHVSGILSRASAGSSFEIRMQSGDKEVLDLGLRRNGMFVPYETISTGEKALLAAAISIGMVSLSKARLKLLLVDNIESIDPGRREAFVAALVSAVKDGLLDQVLVAGVEGVHAMDGLEIFTLPAINGHAPAQSQGMLFPEAACKQPH